MSRRRTMHADSLELLLDTICNTFGGVLFIAILVVLLLQQTSMGPGDSPASSHSNSPADIDSMVNRLEHVNADLDRLRKNRDSQEAIVQSFAPQEIRELLARRSQIIKRQEELESNVGQSTADNALRTAQIETVSTDHQNVKTRLAAARQRHEELQRAVEEDRKSRVEQIRLPVIRNQFGKSEVALIMRYGRVYLWHDYDEFSTRRGLNLTDFVVVGEKSGGLIVHPNPARGIPADDREESRQALRQLLKRFDPKEFYLGIIVRSDSHGTFRHLRDIAIELGFDYHMIPAKSDDPFADRGGSGGQVQ